MISSRSTFLQIILSSNCAAIQQFREKVLDKLLLLLDEVWQLQCDLVSHLQEHIVMGTPVLPDVDSQNGKIDLI